MAISNVILLATLLLIQSVSSDVTTEVYGDNTVILKLEQLQAAINNRKVLESGMPAVLADVEALRADQSETSEKLKDQETKIDSLLEQVSSLTNQFTQFFAEHSQNKQDNEGETVGGHQVDNGVPSVTLQLEATGGAAYIRWGRTSCREEATRTYKGFAASSVSSVTGGGTDLLCLFDAPQWNNTVPGSQGYSLLVGVEYEFASDPFSTRNNNGLSLFNNDMPCALCHVQTRSFQIMIPGRKTCPSGWTMEYWGFIVSTYYTHYKGSFTCLDEAPEVLVGGHPTTTSHLVYAVESSCTALACPPYFLGNEITCVVCSR